MHGLRYLIGLLTLAFAVVGGLWLRSLLSSDSSDPAYLLRLEFRDARGLKPGAFVRYRGVRVGWVRSVAVAPGDADKAVIDVVLKPASRRLARQSSQFWIVTPRFEGLPGGATGLDTLVRDSYVAFLTPEPGSQPLPSGSLLVGREQPVFDDLSATLPPQRAGDLTMTLLAISSEGIAPGSDVRHRGVTVGEVRGVRLAPSGSHVEIDLRVRAAHRRTVSESSTEFWIARPRLSGALLSGLSVEDLSAVIEPFVSYRTWSLDGAPAPDGWRVIASDTAPEEADPEVPESALVRQRSGDGKPQLSDASDPERLAELVVVEVVYEAVEEDWLSADDPLARRGLGLLFVDRWGRSVVLTARSACDGTYFATDTFDGPEIGRESIRIVLPGGGVLRAGRQWIDPDGADLALLVLERSPGGTLDRGTPPERLAFTHDASGDALRRLEQAEDPGQWQLVAFSGAAEGPVADRRGTLILDAEAQVVGLLVQRSGFDEAPAAVALRRLPEDLRPGS